MTACFSEHLITVELGAVTGQVEHLDTLFVGRQLRLDRFGVMHAQVVQHKEDLLLGPANEPCMKSIRMSAFSAPSKIFQRISPLLVTVEITDRPCRLLLTRTTGVCPLGA